MGVFGKLMDSMRIDQEPVEDDYYYNEEEFDEAPPKPSIFSKRKKNDDDYYAGDDYDDKPARSRNKVTTPNRRNMEVVMCKPTEVVDAREITNNLLDGKAVVLNMEGIHTDVAQRIIDFVSGATYSMNGKLQKISNFIFIATPEQVDLSGDFQELFSSGSFDVAGLNLRV